MSLGELAQTYKQIAALDSEQASTDILSSFYGSRAEVDTMKEVLATLKVSDTAKQAMSIDELPLSSTPQENRATAEEMGFVRIE